MVAMSQPALDAYINDLKEDGQLLVDSDLVTKPPAGSLKVCGIAATKTSQTELGSKIFANVVMLGALTRITRLVSREAMKKAITESVAARTKDTNQRAFQLGFAVGESD